jgi:methylmalonyl-CoA/ethylmalonyl-CoA epimerase
MDALFRGVDHVGIAVHDLDAAVAWYRETFGMELVHSEVNDEQGVREAMLSAGGRSDGTLVQLLAPVDANSAIAKFLDRSGPGIQQIAYRVDDMDDVCETLRSRDLRLLYDEPRLGTSGSRINFIHPKDAGGVLVELIEPAH